MKKSLLERAGPPQGILAHIQFEIYPAKGALKKVLDSFSPETTISVACSPTGGIEPTLKLHQRLTENGYKSIPHISARVIKSREHLREVLGTLAKSETKEIMALGGDVWAKAPFRRLRSSFCIPRVHARSRRPISSMATM